MPRFSGGTVEDRINIFKQHLDDLSSSDRSKIKKELERDLDNISFSVYKTLRSSTPVKEDEPSEIFDYRQTAWDKYGVQDYIYETSPSPTIRNYGMHLRDGWTLPEIDFIGSTKDFIQASASFSNIAPHSRLALLGEYSKSSWQIPNQMHGGRKLMMWASPNGNPIFRWVVVNNQRSPNVGPITFHAPRGSLSYIVDNAASRMQLDGERLINGIIQAMKDSF